MIKLDLKAKKSIYEQIVDGFKEEIVTGKLFRSGQLSDLSLSDQEKLKELGPIIIDLRTDAERSERPDVQIDGIEYVHISVLDDLTAGISREAGSLEELFKKFILDPEQARQYMSEMYRGFVSDNSVSKYAEFVRIIIQSESPVLWHCTAGKDRAGIGAVIVEEILGVSKEDIISDYLSTNEFIKNDVRFITDLFKKKAGITDARVDESLGLLLGAEKEYIDIVNQTNLIIQKLVEFGYNEEKYLKVGFSNYSQNFIDKLLD